MSAWWKNFFDGMWISVHDAQPVQERAALEARFAERMLKLKTGAAVLDVPAGEGRIARALAREGYDVTAMDISEKLLRKGAAAPDGDKVRWLKGDMRKAPGRAMFDGVCAFWGSFGYFDDAGNLAQCRAALTALKPGGRFMFQTNVVETLLPGFRPVSTAQYGDLLVREERRWDPRKGRVEGSWTLTRDGNQQVRRTSIRVYTVREIVELLGEAGFDDIETFGSIEGAPFVYGHSRFFAVGRRPA